MRENCILYKFMRMVIHGFNLIIPKNDKYFFLRSAFAYPDNIQAVLDCMIDNGLHKKYTIYCFGTGFGKYCYGIKKLRTNKLLGLYYYFRSKYVIWDSAIFLNAPVVRKQVSVNLWHGVSLKKIGFYEKPTKKKYRTSTYVVTYSTIFAEKMSHAFYVPLDNVLITGEPRNDYLFQEVPIESLTKLHIPIKKECKYVIWMPTFRQSKNHNINNGEKYEFGFPFLNNDNIAQLHDFCVRNNIILIFKWHGSQILPIMDKNEWDNFAFLTTDMISRVNIPLYNIVAICDALITDYSSIFVNYMILNRPICYAYNDTERYMADRGFMFENIKELMPGFHAFSFVELTNFLYEVANNIDSFKIIREKKADILNKYSDGNNSKRLLQALNILQ